MTEQKLVNFLEAGENEHMEFKASFDREAIETLSAFANTIGGRVLIGVEDSGVVHGVELGKETLNKWLLSVVC